MALQYLAVDLLTHRAPYTLRRTYSPYITLARQSHLPEQRQLSEHQDEPGLMRPNLSCQAIRKCSQGLEGAAAE
jgi:hypothetical protein